MSAASERVVMTHAEWLAEGERRFGADKATWRFVCPSCGHVQSTQDYRDAGAPDSAVAFSCVGRWLPGSADAFGARTGGPCNYAGGGLFRLNPVTVRAADGHESEAFAFADAESQS